MPGNIEDGLNRLGRRAPIAPPPELEPKVLAAMAVAAGRRRPPTLARAAALVVTIGAGVLFAAWQWTQEPEGDAALTDAADHDAAYRHFAAQSDQLEDELAAMPQRQVMRGSTAITIVGLEDSIALIDAELGRRDGVSPEYRTALMRDRVEAMNALVNVRYAQSRAFIF